MATRQRPTITLAALVLLALAAWFLCSRWADFPYFYHSDEPSKVRQVIEGTRNLHHPPLMLDAAAALVAAWAVPREPQPVVEVGRMLSAAYCALAAVLLAWAVARRRGLGAGMLAGVLLVLQPDVQEYSRYFKEDPALLFGCAACFAAMIVFEERRSWPWALALGAGAALAASGKYIGAIMVLPAFWIVLFPGGSRDPSAPGVSRGRLVMFFLIGLCVAFALANHRLLADVATFQSSLARETEMVLEGQKGVTKSIPHTGFLERLLNRTWHLVPFLLAGWWAAWVNRRRVGPSEWLLAISPVALAVLLSFSSKDSGRYFLPASLGIAAAAAIGLSALAGRVRPSRWKPALVGGLALLAVGLSVGRSMSYINGFRADARRELLAWMDGHLPPGSRVLQGRKVCLPDPREKFASGWHRGLPAGVAVETTAYLPDRGATPAALAALGFTHVVMAGDEFERYRRTDQKPKQGFADQYQQRAAFYRALEQECPLLWQRRPGKVGTHQPELRLHALRAAP